MAFAKQQYIADLLRSISPFDEKVVSQVVFYGLPMYRLGGGDASHDPPGVPPTQSRPGHRVSTRSTTIVTLRSAPGGLERRGHARRRRYYHANNEIQATAYQPVQPRLT